MLYLLSSRPVHSKHTNAKLAQVYWLNMKCLKSVKRKLDRVTTVLSSCFFFFSNKSIQIFLIFFFLTDRDAVEKRLNILQQQGYIYVTDENS